MNTKKKFKPHLDASELLMLCMRSADCKEKGTNWEKQPDSKALKCEYLNAALDYKFSLIAAVKHLKRELKAFNKFCGKGVQENE